jgi:Rrf2 family transcriptional regulator, cysteine metabolism repressor
MTLLSRKADYALLILSFLHRKAVGGNAREIAEQFGLSRPFVANILKELCQKGFVASHRGVNGGYVLLVDANTISLADLLEAVEDGFNLTMCNTHSEAEEDNCSHESVCTVKGPMAEVHRRLLEVLRGVTLAEVFHPVPMPAFHTATLPLLANEKCCSSGACAVEA